MDKEKHGVLIYLGFVAALIIVGVIIVWAPWQPKPEVSSAPVPTGPPPLHGVIDLEGGVLAGDWVGVFVTNRTPVHLHYTFLPSNTFRLARSDTNVVKAGTFGIAQEEITRTFDDGSSGTFETHVITFAFDDGSSRTREIMEGDPMGRPWLRMTMRYDEIESSIVFAPSREMYDAQQRARLVR